MLKPWQIVLIVIGGLAFAAVVLVGGWQLGWWLKSSATNHQAQIYQQSYGAQSADISQAQSLISEIQGINVQIHDPSTPADEVPDLQAQQKAEINQACSVVDGIAGDLLPAAVQQWATVNCPQ